MKTIVYLNYDETCSYFHFSKYDPFGYCINPLVYSIFGSKGQWVVNCNNCPYRDLVVEDFNYKVAVLGITIIGFP